MRPNAVPGAWPKFVLGGLGVMSTCVNDAFAAVAEEDEDLTQGSQSCAILDKAVFSRSAYHKRIWYLIMPEVKLQVDVLPKYWY